MRKETEDVGGDYGRYEWEADGMTTGDLIQSAARKGGAEAEIEAVVGDAISQRRKAA